MPGAGATAQPIRPTETDTPVKPCAMALCRSSSVWRDRSCITNYSLRSIFKLAASVFLLIFAKS